MRFAAFIPLLIAASPLPQASSTQNRSEISTATLDAAARRAVVVAFGEAMRDRYVFPAVGRRVDAAVRAALAAGKYDAILDPVALSARLSSDAVAIAHDKHLSLQSAAAGPPRSGPVSRPDNEAGVARADRLDGGVGYVEVLGFPPLAFFKPVIDRAMASLAGSRGLIVDMRRNGGGEPEAVAYLVSYLVAEGTPINAIVTRTAGTTNETREAYAAVTTPLSFAGTPVYVLTSKDTFSGGEEFAYDIQALKRGTLIGEVTGGGANPVDMVDLGHGIQAAIPTGRAENPVTKTNWEGRGVIPHVSVPAADALALTLQRVGQTPVREISKASRQQVFGARTTALPGTEAALRRLIAAVKDALSIDGVATPDFAAAAKDRLAATRADLATLGELQSIRFLRPDQLGGDEYALRFDGGDRRMALVVNSDGRVMIATPLSPLRPGDQAAR